MNLAETIRKRRSIFPKTYLADKPISRETIDQLLEAANWAPTHRLTEPWRFVVFHSEESKAALGNYLSGFYKENTPEESFSEMKFNKMASNPGKAGAVIAIVMQRDPEERIPEFEEIASVAMAVQNMWLMCTELGIGSYWSSPRASLQATEFLGLKEGQRCLGLFYMGYHELPEMQGKRSPIEEKVEYR